MRAKRVRRATTRAAVVVCVCAALACDHQRVEESSIEEHRVEVSETTAIEVRIDVGQVDVVAGSADVVEVVFSKHARAADHASARSLLDGVRTSAVRDGDVMRIHASSGDHGEVTFGGSAWADVEIRVPPRPVTLDIRTGDGAVLLSGISGTIDVESGDGRIRLDNVAGAARVRAHDGSVVGTGLSGDFDVVSEDGRIRLEGAFGRLQAVSADGAVRIIGRDMDALADEWSVRAADGPIELALPAGLDARVDATSADGRVVNNLSRFQGAERGNRVNGTIGAGGKLILVTTMDGRVVLRDS